MQRKVYEELDSLLINLREIAHLIGGLGVEAVNMLDMRDRVQHILSVHPDDPALKPFKRRLARIDNTLRKKARLIVKDLDNPEHYRQVLNPPREHWWWYLDELVAEQDRQWLAEFRTKAAVARAK